MGEKVVLITGASRGIGAAAARRFAAGGCKVAVNYLHSREQAEALAKEIGGWAVRADVTDPVQVQNMVDELLDKFCQLDILICNAGVAQQKLFGDLTDEDWRRVFAVNVDGAFYAIRAALPHFIHRKAGKILTVSSMWGQVGASCEVGYSAAKAAVIGLTRALAKELGPSGITVNCVAPGVIATDMNRGPGAGGADRPGGRDPSGADRNAGGGGSGPVVSGLRRRRLHHRAGARAQRRAGDLSGPPARLVRPGRTEERAGRTFMICSYFQQGPLVVSGPCAVFQLTISDVPNIIVNNFI